VVLLQLNLLKLKLEYLKFGLGAKKERYKQSTVEKNFASLEFSSSLRLE